MGEVGEPDLDQLLGRIDAIEVGMHHRAARQVVDLHQGEGRARHFERIVAGEVADQRARERGLAGAEVARQRDHVAGREHGGDVARQPAGSAFVAENHLQALGRRRSRRCRHTCSSSPAGTATRSGGTWRRYCGRGTRSRTPRCRWTTCRNRSSPSAGRVPVRSTARTRTARYTAGTPIRTDRHPGHRPSCGAVRSADRVRGGAQAGDRGGGEVLDGTDPAALGRVVVGQHRDEPVVPVAAIFSW